MFTWFLAIDFGTTNTCAAIGFEQSATAVGFGPQGIPRLPSGVLSRPDGSLAVGFEAERQASSHPGCYDPAPKRSVGQATLLLGGREIPVVEVVAAVLTAAAAEARRQRGGTPPAQVILTCPARWGLTRQSVLRDAATRAGLGDVVLITEPEAAAVYFARHDRVPMDRPIGVYDLGGGTFDAAVLTASPSGFRVTGRPGGMDPLGGDDFDERLLELAIGRADRELRPGSTGTPTLAPARTVLVHEARRAKEDLATHDSAELALGDLNSPSIITRADLRAVAGDDIDATVSEFMRTVRAAGLECSQLAAIYLAGGSSRLPLVYESLTRRLPLGTHRLLRTLDDPKMAVALGAAEHLTARETAREPAVVPLLKPRPAISRRNVLIGVPAAVLVAVGVGIWFDRRDSDTISGMVRFGSGRPVAGAKLLLTSGASDMGGKQARPMTDSNGHYTTQLPRGSYDLDVYATLQYDGQEFQVALSPRASGSTVIELPASGGAKIDLDLKIAGQRPETTGNSADDFFGGSVQIADWYDDTGATQPLSAVRQDLEVTFHFEPAGPMLDGSAGRALDVTRTVGELTSGSGIFGHDRVIADISLGSYVVSANLSTPSGDNIALIFAGDQGQTSASIKVSLAALCQINCGLINASLPVRIAASDLQ